jgi:hypothetical protein
MLFQVKNGGNIAGNVGKNVKTMYYFGMHVIGVKHSRNKIKPLIT